MVSASVTVNEGLKALRFLKLDTVNTAKCCCTIFSTVSVRLQQLNDRMGRKHPALLPRQLSQQTTSNQETLFQAPDLLTR